MKKVVIEDIETGDIIRIEEMADVTYVDWYPNLRIFIDDEEVTLQEKMS